MERVARGGTRAGPAGEQSRNRRGRGRRRKGERELGKCRQREIGALEQSGSRLPRLSARDRRDAKDATAGPNLRPRPIERDRTASSPHPRVATSILAGRPALYHAAYIYT